MTPDLALAPRRPLLPGPGEVILALLLAALLPLFFVSELPWLTSHLPLSNLGHIFFFAVLTLLIQGRYPLDAPRDWLVVTVAILAASVVIELIQGHIGRTASLADIARNLLGSWLVIAWCQTSSPTPWTARILVSTALCVELLLIAVAGFHYFRVNADFPTLSRFEASGDMRQWSPINSKISRSDAVSSEGNHALRADLLPGDFSGMVLANFPRNWQNYKQLHIDLYNPQSAALTMTLRIHDKEHEGGTHAWRYSDRFNQSLTLEPGWNTIAISLQEVAEAPASRLMDLGQTRELQLFVANKKKPKVIYADNLRLSRD